MSGEDIISSACFRLWVATRNKSVLHPEESFRRTLIAHVRGVYGRKPFHVDVERSLLKLLREQVRDGHLFNPWERVFPGNALRIGRRGFNKLGYHEAKAQQQSQKLVTTEEVIQSLSLRQMSDTSPADVGSQKDLKMERTEEHAAASVAPTATTLSTHGSTALSAREPQPNVHIDSATLSEIPESRPITPTSDSVAGLQPIHPGDLQIRADNAVTSGVEPVDVVAVPIEFVEVRFLYEAAYFGQESLHYLKDFAKAMVNSYTFEDLCEMELAATRRGTKIITPACFYFLRQKDLFTSNSSLNYIFPNQEDQRFLPEPTRPLGKFVLNLKTGVFVEEDENCKQLLGRSIRGKFIREVMDSSLYTMVASIRVLPALASGEEVWSRLRIVKSDGSVGLYLSKSKARNEDFAVSTFQDHSDFFQQLLLNPVFA